MSQFVSVIGRDEGGQFAKTAANGRIKTHKRLATMFSSSSRNTHAALTDPSKFCAGKLSMQFCFSKPAFGVPRLPAMTGPLRSREGVPLTGRLTPDNRH